jgi:hypothetical protein
MLKGENHTEMELQSSAETEPQKWQTICGCTDYMKHAKNIAALTFWMG